MKQQYIVSEGHANVYCATHEVVGKSHNDKERVLSAAVRNVEQARLFSYKQHHQRSNPFPMM